MLLFADKNIVYNLGFRLNLEFQLAEVLLERKRTTAKGYEYKINEYAILYISMQGKGKSYLQSNLKLDLNQI